MTTKMITYKGTLYTNDYTAAVACYKKDAEKIELHKDTISISAGAFQNTAFKEIIFNEKLEIIGEGAFENCINLEKIDLSNTKVRLILLDAFYNCNNLKEVILPDTLKIIECDAFSSCMQLEKFNLPKNLELLDTGALDDTKIKSIFVGESLYIPEDFFDAAPIEELIFDNLENNKNYNDYIKIATNKHIKLTKRDIDYFLKQGKTFKESNNIIKNLER